MWRPELIVSRDNHGRISSPTTTAGCALTGGIAAAVAIGSVAGAVAGYPELLLLVLPSCFVLRDVWAWFAATPRQRKEFQDYVALLEHTERLRLRSGDGRLPLRASRAMLGILWTMTALGIALIPVSTSFLLLALFSAAFLAVFRPDAARARRRQGEP